MTWHADNDILSNDIPDDSPEHREEMQFEVEDAEEEEELDFFHPDYRKLDDGDGEES